MAELVLVDDDAQVLELNHKYFVKAGFGVKSFASSRKALQYLKNHSADCVVLDVMMPEMDGFTLCKQLRTFSQVPVIFLTGKVEEEDKIHGLMLGAEDYVEKPYSLKELSARIMVQIRRSQVMNQKQDQNILVCSPITVDLTKHKVFFQETEEIPLTNREFDILLYFINHVDETVTFEEIGMNLWNHYSESDRRSIMVNVSRLRKKLLDATGSDKMIETIWSVGYKLISL